MEGLEIRFARLLVLIFAISIPELFCTQNAFDRELAFPTAREVAVVVASVEVPVTKRFPVTVSPVEEAVAKVVCPVAVKSVAVVVAKVEVPVTTW